MHRRDFLASAAAGLGLGPLMSAPAVGAPQGTSARVACDADRLTRVLVHAPGPETRKVLAFDDGNGGDSMLGLDVIAEEAATQHRRFTELLRAEGAEVLEFTTLLDEAIAHARQEGQLGPWLGIHAPKLLDHARSLDAATLVGGKDAFVYGPDDRGRRFRPLVAPLRFLFFTRDLAVMTPRGLVLCHLGRGYRSFEATLTAFLLRWSPAFQHDPIAFDAPAAGVHLQGGDLIVADEQTLLLGVNNLTEGSAAPALARALGMDVVAVDLRGDAASRGRGRGPAGWTPLRTKFLHLDSVFNLLAPGVALATPYFLEERFAGADPLTEVLRGVSDRSEGPRDHLEHAARALAQIGRVQLYRAHRGDPDPDVRGLKLVDYWKARGKTTLYVGGEAAVEGDVRHFVESVHRELRLQAANVLATRPGHVIAADGNEATEATLRRAGIRVSTFPADALVRWHGGPHCLSLPLERSRPS